MPPSDDAVLPDPDPDPDPDAAPRIRVLGAIGLGSPRETAAGGAIGSARLRCCLAVLAMNSGKVLSTDRLAGLLWPDNQPVNPEAALHTVISRLRTGLAAAGLRNTLITRPPGYLLQVDHSDVDATSFVRLVERATAVLDNNPAQAVDLLDAAIELWRGAPYAEFADQDWALPEVTRLEEYRTTATECRISAALALGSVAEAIAHAELEIGRSPLRERPRELLMLALYRSGRQPEALNVFRDFSRILDDELGLTPSAELCTLHERILRQDSDLGGPPRVEPPSPSAAQSPPSRGNLPSSIPSLIGREHTLRVLIDQLDRHRLVSVTGPGGVGKTQLALTAAVRCATAGQFPGGAWFVELAPVQGADAIEDVLATTLFLSSTAGISMTDRLVEYLTGQRCLLVLDNCEHLIDAVARLAQLIIRRCPSVTILATSQVPLNISAELAFPLAPLAISDSGQIAPAVELFVERAARINAEFTATGSDLAVIGELCRRLDGLPLAIELAAGRMRFMTPSEVLERLPDRLRLLRTTDRLAEERHRTLRGVVEWSYELLGPSERRLFDRLSVFRGAFGLAEAAAISGLPEAEVIDDLGSLAERSMVQAAMRPTANDGTSVTSYSLLQTLQAFGAEQLAARGDAADVQRKHARHVLELVQRGVAAVSGPDSGPWVRTVLEHFDDLRAAHTWAEHNDIEIALELVAGLVDWLEFQVSAEVTDWAQQTAARALAIGVDDGNLVRLTARCLAVAAAGARFSGDLTGALDLVDKALSLYSDPTDPEQRFPLYIRGEVFLYLGRLTESIAIARRVEAMAHDAGDVLREKLSVSIRLLAIGYGGAPAEAIGIAEALLEERHPSGIARAWAAYSLGEVLMPVDPDRAVLILEQVVVDAERLSDRFLTGVALLSAASLRARHGRPAAAVPLFLRVLEHWRTMGNWTQRWTTFRTIAELLERLDDPTSAALLVGAARAESRPAQAFGEDAARLEELSERLATTMGADQLNLLLRSGAALSDEAVFQLAGEALRQQQATPTGSARSGWSAAGITTADPGGAPSNQSIGSSR